MFKFFNRNPKKFVSEEQHLNNMQSQLSMSPQTLDQLRDVGVDEGRELRLEFFFYTNTSDKAAELAAQLSVEGYKVEYGESASDKNIQIITGWTTPLLMTSDKVNEWTGTMCSLGYRQDCEFDGWGTNPDQ
jgi:hypothetical protein